MIKIITFATGSDGNLYLLQNDKTKILVECGVNAKAIRKYLISKNIFISELDGCVVSHSHQDHCLSVDYVSYYIPTYSTKQLCETHSECRKIEPKVPFKIGDIKILPIPVEHGNCENNAFVFLDKDSCVFFGTDFSLMKQNVSNFKFNKVMIECNYDDNELQKCLENKETELREKYERQVSTHMSKINCMEHLDKMNLTSCDEIILLHNSKFLISKDNTIKEFTNKYNINTIYANEK